MIFNSTEESSSKRKFLVPIVILLLCGVALTGAGYAYTSTATGSAAVGDVDYVALDFAGDEYTASTMKYTATEALTYNHTKDVTGEKYVVDSSIVLFTVKVTMNNSAVEESFTTVAPVVTVTSATTSAYGVTFVVGTATGNATDGWTYSITATGTYSGTGAPSTAAINDIVVTANIATA